MIVSMTGYGRGVAQKDELTVVVEGRSLNHRYFDINIKLPVSSFSLERKIREIIRSSFSRGKLDIHIAITKIANQGQLPVNYEHAAHYYQALGGLRDHFGLEEKISLSHLLPFLREILGSQEQEGDIEMYWPLIEDALLSAIRSMQEMRINEGMCLYEDVKKRVDFIDSIINKIQKKFPSLIGEIREQLSAKIAEHFPEIPIDSARLEQELILFAEKVDVTEELTRIYSHLNQLKELLVTIGPIGRKLDFLLQEIHREVNTLGNKTNHLEISQHTVEIKSELEKIREQIQNIE